MRLQARFIQLPLVFDAARLAEEIGSLPATAWRPHPMGFAGNDFLPLVAVGGDPNNESFSGPMRPTPHLSGERPYLWHTLASFGATIGRTRLMRLSGGAEVTEHSDVNYYWRERMRVHVPIVTQPEVKFHCGGLVTHMAAGESWIFDTWHQHNVINHDTKSRIHLVMDTVGGAGLFQLIDNGRNLERTGAPGWTPRRVPPSNERAAADFESFNVPHVMSPWEVRDHVNFLLSEVKPAQSGFPAVVRASLRFCHVWRAIWSAHAEGEAGWAQYRSALDVFSRELRAASASTLALKNDVDFLEAAHSIVIEFALSAAVRQNLNRRPVATVSSGSSAWSG